MRVSTFTGLSLRLLMGILVVILFALASLQSGAAQQPAYLVTAADSSVSVFDLATNNLIEKINEGNGEHVLSTGPNPRLSFVGCGPFLSVIDLTIGREVQRIWGVYASLSGTSIAFTKDGKWALVADIESASLDVIDAATLQIVRRVALKSVMGQGAYDLNSVIVVGSKAYISTGFTDSNSPAIAEVDLNTFTAKSITVPAGYLDLDGIGTVPNLAATPDGRYAVFTEVKSADYTYHLFFISTITDRVVLDKTMNLDPQGLVVTSVANPTREYGYLAGFDYGLGATVAEVIDLRPGSQTYGQLISSSEVDLTSAYGVGGLAISPDGSRLITTVFHGSQQGPQPNALVLDTALMLSDPSQAIVAQPTVAGGARTYGVNASLITASAPPTAPTVTGVSGNVTNNAATPIHIFGTNFASDARVRIGSMANLPATVDSSNDLQVTVPINAPAGPGLDVIVTNPEASSPPAQQNQSGVLAGGLNILLNPSFQPRNQIAALNQADGSLAVFDFTQRAMLNVAMNQPAKLNLAYNYDGVELYSASNGFPYAGNTPEVLSVTVPSDSTTPISLGGGLFRGYRGVAPALNPFTGNPAVIYSWNPTYGEADLQVNMIDTNPGSPTFNTILATFDAGLAGGYLSYSGTATPNGKYVYVSFYDFSSGAWNIAIFDIVNGGPATIIDTAALGIYAQQPGMYVTADNQSLLLVNANGAIAVFDIGEDPTSPTLVTTIKGVLSNYFLLSYQVVGTRLFALDGNSNMLLAFNFDRQHSNFTRLGGVFFKADFAGTPSMAMSPDGSLIYVPVSGDDMISVFDANKLATGQQPLITNLANFRGPTVATVSPVTH